MRRATPDDGMAEGPLSSIVGRFDARDGNERPECRIQRDQATASFGGTVIGTEQALGQPMAELTLNGRELGQERLIG